MDKYLVTVGRFRQFVKAWNNGMGYLPAAGSGKHTHLNGGKGLIATGGGYEPGWLVADNGNIAPDTSLYCNGIASRTWTSTAGSQENLPINCVNWWEAYAFCIWDGGFLPSDAECEYAAAGGSQQREYPWGSTAPGMACPGTGCYAIYGCNYPPNSAMNCATGASIAPVGTATLGAALWGQLDMAGEVFEWNLDHQPPYFDPCTDCAAFTAGPYRAIRGRGAFDRSDVLVFTFVNPAADYSIEVGFRCARTP
jgi:formylglycine-generating enzyme required for sulfatase activity